MQFLVKVIVLSILIQNGFSYELDPIVITSKQDSERSKVASSIYVVNQSEIENKGHFRMTELLKQVPGIQVSSTGVVGGEASVFIRGAESRHTAVLIDGVKVYDPSSPTRTFNLNNLNVLDVEKIEVLKGPQSVLYGSDAIGGIINIITKKGETKNRAKVGFGVVQEGSIGHTFDISKGVIYVNPYYQQSDFASDVDDKNFSDAKINKGLTVTSNLFFEKFETTTTFKSTNDYAQTDAQDLNSNPYDNKNAYVKHQSYFLKQNLVYNQNENEKYVFDLNHHKMERLNNAGSGLLTFKGDVTRLEARKIHNIQVGNVVSGLDIIQETYTDDQVTNKKNSTLEAYANMMQDWKSYHFDYGARITSNNYYGKHIVYGLGVSKSISENHLFRLNHKTAFQAPSTYQTLGEYNGSPVGNEDLAPEKSKAIEAGYDFNMENMMAGIAVFQNEVEDLITFGTSTYGNTNKFQTQGVDTYFRWQMESSSVGLNMAFYDYKTSAEKEVARRAKDTFDVFYEYIYSDMQTFGGNLKHVGPRVDYVGNNKKTLGGYEVVDLNYTLSFGDLMVKAIVLNFLDKRYELVSKYNTQRRGIQLNVEYVY